jgi:hypothetical protein
LLLPLFMQILFRSLCNEKTISRLVTVSLSYFDVASPNRVSIFFKHYSVQTLALRRIISVNFKRNKGKSS